MDASRRSFLRGRMAAAENAPSALRPPWAGDESRFVATCTRCSACANACPTRVIVAGAGAYPTLDFRRGECTLCGKCVTACADGALQQTTGETPWQQYPHVATHCLAHGNVECRVCAENCERGAIRFRPRLGGVALPEVDAAACNGCGACVAPCPVGALNVERMQ